MKQYKYKKGSGLVDETGRQVLVMLPSSCSKAFLITCYKLLAEKLNTIERGKGLTLKQAKETRS